MTLIFDGRTESLSQRLTKLKPHLTHAPYIDQTRVIKRLSSTQLIIKGTARELQKLIKTATVESFFYHDCSSFFNFGKSRAVPFGLSLVRRWLRPSVRPSEMRATRQRYVASAFLHTPTVRSIYWLLHMDTDTFLEKLYPYPPDTDSTF